MFTFLSCKFLASTWGINTNVIKNYSNNFLDLTLNYTIYIYMFIRNIHYMGGVRKSDRHVELTGCSSHSYMYVSVLRNEI